MKEQFPQSGKKELKNFSVEEGKTAEEILKEMEAAGFRPATAREVLELGGYDVDQHKEEYQNTLKLMEEVKEKIQRNLESFKKVKEVVETSADSEKVLELKHVELLIDGYEYALNRQQMAIDYHKAMMQILEFPLLVEEK